MAHESGNRSGYDKNIRSLLDAMSMLEREIALVMDRVGIDRTTLTRALEVVGVLSSDLARQAAGALGLADARAMETLGRDVRTLLEQVARLRRRDGDVSARLDRLEEAAARLDGAASTLARLQGKARGVIARLEQRSEAFEQILERRLQQLDAVDALRSRIEHLEALADDSAAAAETRSLARPRVARAIRGIEAATGLPSEHADARPPAKPVAR